ncbi:MAG: radical SAM protein [Candidatus Humimicrobiaceae bacterium]
MKFKYLIRLFNIYSAYILGKQETNYPPIKLWIEISSICNLKCRLCVNKELSSGEKKDMDFDLFKKIIDEIKDYAYEINLFHRGEPLLNPNIAEMAEYAFSRKIKTRLFTNGVLLTAKLSERLIKSGLDLITFSFDGYTKEVYEKNRCGAVFEETLENITCFLKIKRRMAAGRPAASILVMEYADDLSPHDFRLQKKEFAKRFKGLPLDRIITRKPHNWGGSLNIKSLAQTGNSGSEINACTFLWYALVIFFNGKVAPCPQDFFGKLIVGDVNNQTIKDIFNSNKMQNLRKSFKCKNIEDLNICRDCDRCRREKFLGVPKEYLGKFIKNIFSKN